MVEIDYIKDDVDGWTACVQQYLHFLPKKALSRIKRAIAKPQSNLLSVMAKSMFDVANQTYVPLSDEVWVPGYNHKQTLAQSLKNRPITEVGTDGIQYFTNTLTVPHEDDAGRYFPPPSERIINCGFYVHTFEVDPTENYQEGLIEQISWCMGGKKDINCKIGEVYKELSRYKDFRALEYVWSGNKSCHLHIIFDTRHLSPQRFDYSRKTEVDADLADHHPKVAAWMEDEKAAMWDQLNAGDDKLRPVFFTVHAVVKQWHAVGGTRLWMHPDYAQERQKDQPNMKALSSDMRVQWIIYDEVKMEDLLHRYPAGKVKLVRKMSKKFAKLSPSEQLQAYNTVAPEHMEFDEARKIGSLNFKEKHLKTVDTSREGYGVNNADDGPYLSINGNKYYVKFQDWWRKEEKTRITFLTTEHRIVRAMENMPNGPLVLNFDRPELFDRDETTLNLILDNRANREKTDELVADIKTKHPNGAIITNMVDDKAVTKHDTAKGSNSFNQGGADTVTAIYHMLSPNQYEQLLIENAVFDTKDMVKLFHLDQFNQTCGRTLGFRKNPNITTQAMMSKRLWREIGISIEMDSRYRVSIIH